MPISRLTITNVRNIRSAAIKPAAGANIFVGVNGSGKTSLLEAVHMLARARSFRSNKHRTVINREEQGCTVFGGVSLSPVTPEVSVGVQRDRSGGCRIKVGGEVLSTIAPLAELIPLQVVAPDSFGMLDAGPKSRRQYIDWGVFHVEQSFLSDWQRLNRSLKQRNRILRRGKIDAASLAAWDHEFVSYAERITAQRERYVNKLEPYFLQVLGQVSDLEGLAFSFYPGWDAKISLAEVLGRSLESDQKQGYTQQGPQRSDLRVKYQGRSAADTLSRGQQKLVISAMKIAQGRLFAEMSGRRCTYLVDDLAAELDEHHARALYAGLAGLDSQLFVTSVNNGLGSHFWKDQDAKVFHVEHGTVTAAD